MADCLDEIARVLDFCSQLSGSEDLATLDRIVLRLKSLCGQLAIMGIQESLVGDEAEFSQLYTYLNQLCVEYETRMLFMLPMNPTHEVRSFTHAGRGRPRKVINIALVSTKITNQK